MLYVPVTLTLKPQVLKILVTLEGSKKLGQTITFFNVLDKLVSFNLSRRTFNPLELSIFVLDCFKLLNSPMVESLNFIFSSIWNFEFTFNVHRVKCS